MTITYHDDLEQFLNERDKKLIRDARYNLEQKMKTKWVVTGDKEGNIIRIDPDGTETIIRDKLGNIINPLIQE